MNEYLLLMHTDATDTAIAHDATRWMQYLESLRASGQFDGGSAIGAGVLCRKGSPDAPAPGGMDGYIRVRAASLAAAQAFLDGNPVYDGGGTVEVRELPRE